MVCILVFVAVLPLSGLAEETESMADPSGIAAAADTADNVTETITPETGSDNAAEITASGTDTGTVSDAGTPVAPETVSPEPSGQSTPVDGNAGPEIGSDKASSVDTGMSETAAVNTQEPEKVHFEKTLTAKDSTYNIEVTYDETSGIPENAGLSVTELVPEDKEYDYNHYAEKSIEEAGLSDSDNNYIRLFDIKILNPETKEEYQPEGNVRVSIELPEEDIALDDSTSVVHFKDPEKAEIMDSDIKRETIEFETTGFSVYAIVRGPDPVSPPELERAVTLEDLTSQDAEGGFYMAVERNGSVYYITNTLSSSGCLVENTSLSRASIWYLEPTGTENRYSLATYDANENKLYITNPSGNLAGLSETGGLTFDFSETGNDKFFVKITDVDKWLQHSNGGNGIRFWTDKKDATNPRIIMFYADSAKLPDDAYSLSGKTYGIMNYSDGISGKALMAEERGGLLSSRSMVVRQNPVNSSETLAVSKDSDITMWRFTPAGEDRYILSSNSGGSAQFIKADGAALRLVSDMSEATQFQFSPGTGAHAGRFMLYSDMTHAVYVTNAGMFGITTANTGRENQWLYLVELSDLDDDDFVTYSAKKVSISDTESVYNGAKVIVYTRTWNDEEKKYEFYAVNHDGSLIRCYESGDSIEWVGNKLNTLLWNFTEYYFEGTSTPNYYYELKNPYSGKFIAPQINEGQILSDDPIGINLNGRRYGDYYSKIIAWDDAYYSYAGLRAEGDNVVSDSIARAGDFYFAIMEDLPAGELVTVPTVDHTQYGITMKLVNFTSDSDQNSLLGSTEGGAVLYPVQGLLSTDLKDSGYPQAVNTGQSLGALFAGAREVNNLFIESTYHGTGYYEYDSTQNFASIQDDGNFKVYRELGTTDLSNKPTLKHGQFFPYNDLNPNLLASVNGENLYTATAAPLSDADPRKHEPLYLVPRPDYYFGVEIDAGFVQTPNGLDAWGHDIIYEFTGDDDFWLYVDGELVIDLGGIHSALPGSVNYSTGDVSVNGVKTTLYDIFRSNYEKRGMSEEQIAAKLSEIFERKTINGKQAYIFKDYSAHNMKIFFMERGAGASNLHMKFNLSSAKPGQVVLEKQISGTEKSDYRLAEYAYQIYYQDEENGAYKLLEKTVTQGVSNVVYYNTNIPVKYESSYTPAGGTGSYQNAFFLTPGQAAVITMPANTISYYIKECGVNSQVYDTVYVNEDEVAGTATADPVRKDYATTAASIDSRPRVVYDNHVSDNAKRILTITKKLYDADDNLITDDPTGFNFRLYLGNENESDISTASLQDYQVKTPDGYYCRWDKAAQSFVSIGKNDYSSLTEDEKIAVTFQTSFNGAISKIPSEYKVEVRDLIVGTRFMVEERATEIPEGYSFIKYEREEASYIIDEGDTVNSGTVRDNASPAVEVRNRRGFGFTVNKAWSDASYVDSHGDIFTAVYAGNTLVPGSVRRIKHPSVSTYYYWDSLLPGRTISDYEAYEVELSGDYTVDENGNVIGGSGFAVRKVDSGGTVSVEAKAKGETESYHHDYTVSYERGPAEGAADNLKTDTVTNTRNGVKLVLEKLSGGPLSGGVFTLKDENGGTVGSDSYVSDTDGLITIAYIKEDTVYTLKETAAPHGWHGLEKELKFSVHSGEVTVSQGDSGLYTVTQAGSGSMAVITVKNRPFAFSAVKVGMAGLIEKEYLEGVHFALHRGVSMDGGEPIMDYVPISGYEDLVTDADGVIPRVNGNLAAGTYFLKEMSVPEGYSPLEEPVRFTVTDDGRVLLADIPDADLSDEISSGTLVYKIRIKNYSSALPAPTGIKGVHEAFPALLIAGIGAAVAAVILRKRKRVKA